MKTTNTEPDKKVFVDGKMQVGEYQPEIPTSLPGKLKVLLITIIGKVIFIYLKARFGYLIADFKPLAMHLEKQVFPDLRNRRIKWLTIKPVIDADSQAKIVGFYDKKELNFPGMSKLHETLTKKKIKGIELSTHLESNQLIETILMLFWVVPIIESCSRKPAGFWTWNRQAIASGMLTANGFHRFCADMRFNLESRFYQVDYTYCELFMAKLIKGYSRTFSRFSDHRAYFAMAPLASISVFLIFSLPLILIILGFNVWSVYWLPAVILPPIGAWFIMHIIGAMQYDMEHRDHLLSEYIRQEKVFARFPEVNPNPIYKVSSKGEIIYINPAASTFLHNTNVEESKAEVVLPDNYIELLSKSLKEQEPLDIEFNYKDNVFRYMVSPFIEDQSVLFAGSDITYLRKIEEELRDINAHLESLVQQRTSELQLTQEATIICLASLAEVRDPETGEHIERTRLYVRAMANHMKNHRDFKNYLDERTINTLYNSAPLHDIGKVGIPDAILLKPGRHTPEETIIMKKHTTFGADALQAAIDKLGFDSFLNIAKEIALSHHERWDGTGYPRMLKGEDIPISSRLMAIADVYDALISKRVYKPAFTHETARDIIVADSGTHFDPTVVNAFLEIEEEFKTIAAQFPDQD